MLLYFALHRSCLAFIAWVIPFVRVEFAYALVNIIIIIMAEVLLFSEGR